MKKKIMPPFTNAEVPFQGEFLRLLDLLIFQLHGILVVSFSLFVVVVCLFLWLSTSPCNIEEDLYFLNPNLTTKCIVKVFMFCNLVRNVMNIGLTLISFNIHESKHSFYLREERGRICHLSYYVWCLK